MASTAFCMHTVAQCIAADRGKLLTSTLPLPDLAHHYIPVHPQWEKISESLLGVSAVLLTSSCVSTKSIRPVTHFLVLWSIAMSLRAVTMVCTTLPDSSQKCEERIPFEITHEGVKMGSCHDLIFSGHMTTTMLCCLVAMTYLPVTTIPAFTVLGVHGVAIAASRKHYLVDVVLSFIICGLLFIATLHSLTPSATPSRAGACGNLT
jgi:hypothetical protein